MKKLFATKQDSHYDGYIGKQYGVGDLTLVVEAVIAEGGFSYVFLVRETSKNKIWALKRMLVNSQSDLENCKQEIQMLKQFHRHPSVVTFKGHHTKHLGNGIYEVLLLMQHCPNGTVLDLMNQNIGRGFSEELIRTIYVGIVEAVALLHSSGYMHRDLKVENILIGPNKEFVLCDFGSAYKGVLDPEAQGHTFVEENINKCTTLAYRAPEMCDMYLGYKIGPPADAWALGVLLYKLCFFTTPFEENTLAIARAKYTIPDPDKYSEQLMSVIRDTLLVDPSKRLTARQISSRLKGRKNSSTCSTTTHSPLPRDTPLSRDQTPAEEPVKGRSRPRGSSEGPRGHRQEGDRALPHFNQEGRVAPLCNKEGRAAPLCSKEGREAPLCNKEGRAAQHSKSNQEGHIAPLCNQEGRAAPLCNKGRSVSSPPLPSEPSPWGNALSQRSPASLVYLPPPPSPARQPRRGHSRAKSDTTFLKNPLLETEPEELSASSGQLSGAGGTPPTPHETNFEITPGFTTNPFSPSSNPFNPAPLEDEFLKLSLRGNSQSKLQDLPGSAPSSKVSRASRPDQPSSRERSLSLRPRAFSNEEITPLSRTLSSPSPTSLHLSTTSLSSLDTNKKRARPAMFGRRKTMSREMISEQVMKQEQFVNKHSSSYRKSVLGNPLHGDLM